MNTYKSSLFFLLFAFLPLCAQKEPCGFFEVNGVPGFDETDFLFATVLWGEEGPQIADFDGNGIVEVTDLVRMISCVGDLSHGLMARYYGFEDGDPNQDIPFPDFDNLPGNPNPVVMNVATTFNEFEGYAGFLCGCTLTHCVEQVTTTKNIDNQKTLYELLDKPLNKLNLS